MNWYNELSQILLKDNIKDNRSFARVQAQLEKRVINLYKAIISYLIKTVCSYYRNWFITFLRDTVKLDDWNGNLKNVQDAENAVREDCEAYNTQSMQASLAELTNTANTLVKELVHSKEDKDCL